MDDTNAAVTATPAAVGRSTRRVVVAITSNAGSAQVIDRAGELSRDLGADLRAVAVAGPAGFAHDAADDLHRHRLRVEALGGSYHEVVGSDVASAIAAFLRTERATDLVLGASSTRWPRRSVASRLEAMAETVDLHVVARAEPSTRMWRHTAPIRRSAGLSRRRQLVGLGAAIVSLPLLTALLVLGRDQLSQAMVFLLYLAVVVLLAAVGGPVVGVISAAVAFLLVNWFFTEPLHTLNVADAEKVAELIIFLAVSGTVAALVSAATRRAQQALQLRTQASLLASAAGTAIGGSDPTASLLEELRTAIGATRISIDENADTLPPGCERLALTGGRTLTVEGPRLDEDSRVLARAFGDQIIGAMRTRELARQAARAEQLRATNDLRSALLRAVSHDLRTPLASAKIATSSLRSTDVVWSDEVRDELLSTADGEIDRLILIVENLLDASRLQAGVVVATIRPVNLATCLMGAIASLAASDRSRVTVHVDDDLPLVQADEALTSRVVANLLSNALAADDGQITVEATRTASSAAPGSLRRDAATAATAAASLLPPAIDVRVIDHGPGIPPERREAVFMPFQRFSDRSTGAGVGLGLAICAGFCEAMGVALALDETPGGGATARLRFDEA